MASRSEPHAAHSLGLFGAFSGLALLALVIMEHSCIAWVFAFVALCWLATAVAEMVGAWRNFDGD